MHRHSLALTLILTLTTAAVADEQIVSVSDDASLRTALREAKPGTRIRIAPGRYPPGVWVGRPASV